MFEFIKVIVFLAIVVDVNCSFKKNLEGHGNDGHTQFLFIFVCIALVATIRYILKKYEISIPYPLFAICIGFLAGVVTTYGLESQNLVEVIQHMSMNILTPYCAIIIFNTAFCIDVHSFYKQLPQIFIVSVPVTLMSTAIVGLVVRLIIDAEWKILDGMFVAIILSLVYPTEKLFVYKPTGSVHLKQSTVILDGETILSTTFLLMISEMVQANIMGFAIYWYHFVCGILRFVIIGIPLGYLCGLFGTFFMRMTYNDIHTLTVLTLIMPHVTYTVSEYTCNSGILCNVIVGLMMGGERAALPGEIDQALSDHWLIIFGVMNIILYCCVGVNVSSNIVTYFTQYYLYVFVIYLMCNVARFLSFLLFYPMLSRIGYRMSIQNMIICAWMGLRSPLVLTLMIYMHNFFSKTKAEIISFHIVMTYCMFLLVNGTLLPVVMKILGMLELSDVRQINMSNCMANIMQVRERTVAILKMDRFLADANWPYVIHKTHMRHPYRSQGIFNDENEDEEDETCLVHRLAICPDCKKTLPTEPTPKELKDMLREAKLRVLKLKKILYSRQCENGMMSKEGLLNLHQAIETAMEKEEALIELDGLLKLFNKEGFFFRFIYDRVVTLLQPKDEKIKPPRKHWRLVCYRFIKLKGFRIFMYCVILCNLLVVILAYIKTPTAPTLKFYIIYESNVSIFLVLFVEFWLKIFGYSWIYIWKHGFRRYFRSSWNILDSIAMFATLCDVILNTVALFYTNILRKDYYTYTLYTIMAFRLLKTSRFLQFLSLCRGFYPKFVKYLDSKIDKHRAMAYELGKNYVAGENEILENLSTIVENEKIKDELRNILDKDRIAITKVLGLAQKDRPKVASSVKSKLVMRTILNSMKKDIHVLKNSGWIDDYEYATLQKSLLERYKFVSSIKIVPQPRAKHIFKEISWMGEDDNIIDFLYNNVTIKKFNTSETLCREGEMIEGIYILVTGLLEETYLPQKNVLENLERTGALPIVDYLPAAKFDEPITDYIVTGNCIGELSMLTQRPYNCSITSEALSQVFVLKNDILKEAMKMDFDPVKGLECRIWKTVSFRIAMSILAGVPAYRNSTQEQIKLALERSFVPNLSNYKIFVVNDMMEDVILIEGSIIDFNTRDVFRGPCYVPRSIQKCILPKSSILSIDDCIETKLLIISGKNFNEYDIILEEELVCELVDDSPEKYLQYLIQTKTIIPSKTSVLSKGALKKIVQGQKKWSDLQSMESKMSRITENVTLTPSTSLRRVQSKMI